MPVVLKHIQTADYSNEAPVKDALACSPSVVIANNISHYFLVSSD